MDDSLEQFKALSRADELRLLRGDDEAFSAARAYLEPLVRQALTRIDIAPATFDAMKNRILDQVPVAAERFLSQRDRPFSFAAYFTWYIHEAAG